MDVNRLREIHRKLLLAVIQADARELPAWRFDGKAVTTPEEVAYALSIPLSEAKARLQQVKDVYGASGAGATTYGVGTVRNRTNISQRAGALASKKRRRRKKETKR
jgi:hypothetical protein